MKYPKRIVIHFHRLMTSLMCFTSPSDIYMDLKIGYWQVEVSPSQDKKTTFTSGFGLWKFAVMPFGFYNAPATFERLMATVLQGLIGKICFVYLDDVVVFGSTVDELL